MQLLSYPLGPEDRRMRSYGLLLRPHKPIGEAIGLALD